MKRSKLTIQDMREIAHFHAVVLAYLKMQRLLDKDKGEPERPLSPTSDK